MSLNKRMGDKHERDLAAMLSGYASRGSGNQWHNSMDGRTAYTVWPALAWDCKSTMGKSIGVSREMWRKAKEQAGGHLPLVPLRFYDNERLDVGLDLAVIDLNDLAMFIEKVRDCDCA